MELWNRTSGACGNGDKPLPWNVKTQGMAEAAKMLALLCCIDHENKHKSNDEMKELRRKLKLKGRSAREKFRKAQKRPLDPQNAKQAVDYLEESAERLESGEWNLGSEGLQEGAARRHREKARELRLEIVKKKQQEDQ